LKKQILGLPANAKYNGFTSCPLILDNNDVLLAEFRYGLEPDETFTKWGLDQSEPRKIFYQMSASSGATSIRLDIRRQRPTSSPGCTSTGCCRGRGTAATASTRRS
jgi:hypothetical protein